MAGADLEVDALLGESFRHRLRGHEVAWPVVMSRQAAGCAILEILQPAAAGIGDVAHDIRVVDLGARFRHAPTPVPLSNLLLNGRLGRWLVNGSLIRPTRMRTSGAVTLEAAADAVAPGPSVWVVHESEQRRRPRPLCSGHVGQLVGDDPAGWPRAAFAAVVPGSECVRLMLESFEGLLRVQQVLVVAILPIKVLVP